MAAFGFSLGKLRRHATDRNGRESGPSHCNKYPPIHTSRRPFSSIATGPAQRTRRALVTVPIRAENPRAAWASTSRTWATTPVPEKTFESSLTRTDTSPEFCHSEPNIPPNPAEGVEIDTSGGDRPGMFFADLSQRHVSPCVRVVVASNEAVKDESKIHSVVQTAGG